jgi:hypothetical protein
MKESEEIKFDFRQKQFLKQIDPKVLDRAAVQIGKAKAEAYKRRTREVKEQQAAWEKQSALMRESSSLDVEKARREFERLTASQKKEPAPKWPLFEGHNRGSNPRFHAPNFFNPGYGRTVGGVNSFFTWEMDFGRGPEPVPYSSPTHGLMGVQISTANPGGYSSFNTGLSNLFFSQSAQTVPLSANFMVTGHGFSYSVGLGYSRAWVRLGVEAWVSGPARSGAVQFLFVSDFWSSVPSPWVAEDRHFAETFSTGVHSIALLPGDLVLGSAIIDQGCVCGGLFTFSRSAFLVSVPQLQIGP